ncbi:MAG: hypothetical protein VXZ96_01865 [Myxococcota bacterium]|nr:hypothetical protein [Myxococcota bacterium]
MLCILALNIPSASTTQVTLGGESPNIALGSPHDLANVPLGSTSSGKGN